MQRITRKEYLDLRQIAELGTTSLSDWEQLHTRYSAYESFVGAYQRQRAFNPERRAAELMKQASERVEVALRDYNNMKSNSRRQKLMDMFQLRRQHIEDLVLQLRENFALFEAAERSFFFVLVLSAVEQRAKAHDQKHLALASEVYQPLLIQRYGLLLEFKEVAEAETADEMDRIERDIERVIGAAERHSQLFAQIHDLAAKDETRELLLDELRKQRPDWEMAQRMVREASLPFVPERVHERLRALENELPLMRDELGLLDLELRIEQLRLLQ